jgi:predicted transcriptional regulator
MGSLEAQVLSALWAAGSPRTPRQVHDALGADLAYTTTTTILTRLWQKGLVGRRPAGRAFEYWPLVSEAELAATRMLDALAKTPARERASVLSTFVNRLGKRDEAALRRLLEGADDR